MRRRKGTDEGFTLVELLVATACMVVLSAMAVPKLQGYVLEARLNGARPYLMEIAARQRMYRIETGQYCCTAYNGASEETLVKELNLSLAEAGDFCFVFICRSSALCERTTASQSYISPPPGAEPDFEVWALLRRSSGTAAVTGPGGSSCTPATGKAEPAGWVRASSPTNVAGRAGQVVALRHPPPPNGLLASSGTYHAVRFEWRDGVSLSDALLP